MCIRDMEKRVSQTIEVFRTPRSGCSRELGLGSAGTMDEIDAVDAADASSDASSDAADAMDVADAMAAASAASAADAAAAVDAAEAMMAAAIAEGDTANGKYPAVCKYPVETAEAAQVTQDDAAVMAAIEERARVAAQTAAAAPNRLGGGLAHMQAALRRQMEVDQAAAAAAAGGGIEHRMAEAVEATQAQEHLEKASRFGRMGEAVKLVQQSSCFQMASALEWAPYGPPGLCWSINTQEPQEAP